MEVNKIYHDDWMNNQLPDKSVHLIIAVISWCGYIALNLIWKRNEIL